MAPPAEAGLGFRVTAEGPDFAAVGEKTRITGTFKNGAIPAPGRMMWLMHQNIRLAETTTTTLGHFTFDIPWPLVGLKHVHVVGDPGGPLYAWSDWFPVTGTDQPGAPPATVTVKDPGWERVRIDWQPGPAPLGSERSGWRVYRAPHGTKDWSLRKELGVGSTSFADLVDTGTWYHYAVHGINPTGEGDGNELLHRTIGPNASAVSPGSIDASNGISWRRLVVGWPDPVVPLGREVETFRLYRTPNGTEAWTRVAEVAASERSFEDVVDALGLYDYAVAGWNRHGEGPWTRGTFEAALLPADEVTVTVEKVRVCTTGWNAGTVCWDAQEGRTYATYDDARVSDIAVVASFTLRNDTEAVREAPVQVHMHGWIYCEGCPEATREKTKDTDMDGNGRVSFDFGAFADPVGTCYIYVFDGTATYPGVTGTDQYHFRVCD